MKIPATARQGDTVRWRDLPTVDQFGAPVNSSGYVLRYYIRGNEIGSGDSVVGLAANNGWDFEWTVNLSKAGQYFWQAVAESIADSTLITLGAGQIEIQPSLSFTGVADAFDGRSQAQKDLDAVQSAIRTLLSGGSTKEYKIGNRSIKRYDMAELLQLEAKLKADVAREKQAEMIANGLGNPRNMFVRFNA